MSIASIRRRLTRQKFQSFLDGQSPRKLAGRAGCQLKCPLAVYLGKHEHELTQVHIQITRWYVTYSGHIQGAGYKKLPRWAQDFITAVDCHAKINGSVTYGTCAKLLRNL